jgi:hypothetical protein
LTPTGAPRLTGRNSPNNLLLDAVADWPRTAAISYSAFVKRFTCGLLIVCIGQKNPALAGRDPGLAAGCADRSRREQTSGQ